MYEITPEFYNSTENEARQCALVESLRERIREMESAHGTLENMRTRTEATISQLTEEKRQFEEKVHYNKPNNIMSQMANQNYVCMFQPGRA